MAVARKPSAAAARTSSGVLEDFPEFAPGLIAADGAQETNAAIQEWWDTLKYQLLQIQDTNQQQIKIVATAAGPTGTLQAQITLEKTVRANADEALGTEISTVSATLTTSIGIVAASVVTEATARATADGFLSANYSVTVTAGNVVTGLKINSSTGSGAPISTFIVTAAVFQVWDGTSTAYPIFGTSPGVVTLASTLTVNTSGKVFIGTGTYANTNTAWYVDSAGKFSLKDKLTWDGTTLTITGSISATTGTIGGWNINSTTLSKNNAILDSAGNLLLGTANDVVILSATDATYRLWAGNATAGSAAFTVTKAGVMSATGGTFTGGTLDVGTGARRFFVSGGTLNIGDTTYKHFTITASGADPTFLMTLGDGSTTAVSITANATYGSVAAGNATDSAQLTGNKVELTKVATANYSRIDQWGFSAYDGSNTISAYPTAGFTGIGSAITQINASNISSGTLANARLPTSMQLGDGSAGAPTYSFASDTDTGIRWNSSGDMRFVTNGTDRMVVRDAAVVFIVDIKIANARAAGAPIPGGTVTILDSTGATVSLITT